MGKSSKLATLAAWALLAASCWWEAKEQKVSNFDFENTKSSLVENFSDDELWDKTITWEDAKEQVVQRELQESIIGNEKFQELVKEYWEEKTQEILNTIFTSEKMQEIIEEALKDEDIQKALEDWDQEGVTKGIEKIMKDSLKNPIWLEAINRLFIMILGVVVWEVARKNSHR